MAPVSQCLACIYKITSTTTERSEQFEGKKKLFKFVIDLIPWSNNILLNHFLSTELFADALLSLKEDSAAVPEEVQVQPNEEYLIIIISLIGLLCLLFCVTLFICRRK